MRLLFLGLAALCISGCAGEPKSTLRVVEIPTPVACAPKVALIGAYPDSATALARAPDLFERVKLLLAGRTLRDADIRVLRGALAGCGADIGEDGR